MNAQELFAALHRDGHVGAADAPPMAEVAPRPPWYVRVLLGFIGWLGGLLVLGFFAIFVSGLLNNAAGMSVISAMLFFGSFTIYRIAPHNEFASQFALAASICAQALAAGAFWRITGHGIDTAVVAGFIAAMQALLVWLMPNFLHRLLSTIFAVAALFFATHDGHASVLASLGLGVGFVMLLSAESRLIADGRHQLVDPVLNGLAIGLLVVGVGYLDFGGTRWLPFATFSALAFGVALLLWLVQNTKTSDPRSRTAALIAAVVFIAVSWRAPGLIASTLVLLAAFATGRRALTGLALVALPAWLVAYYYQMSLTLLAKSGVLTLTGAALIAMWWVHRRWFSREAT